MKRHTTNYYNTFIEIAEDCPAIMGEVPPVKGDKVTVANLQYDILINNPYRYTSDEVLFSVFAKRKDFVEHEMEEQETLYFSKGQPCFRSSPLTKRYGWGVHANKEGKIAIFGVGSEEYERLMADDSVEKTRGMRSKRVKKS